MRTNYQVGDYVRVSGRNVRLDAVHTRKVGFHLTNEKLTWVFLNKVEPIVIDNAFMELNGFVKCDDSEYCMYTEYDFEYETGLNAKSRMKDCVNVKVETGSVRVTHMELNYTMKDGKPSPTGFRNTYEGNMNYVHELQRVFDICGIDKKLEI